MGTLRIIMVEDEQRILHGSEWMMADGTPENLKKIVLTVPKDNHKKISSVAESDYLCMNHPENRFHLFYHLKPITREEIWSHTVRIKNILENKVMPTQGQIFILEHDEAVTNSIELYDEVKIQLQNNVKQLSKKQLINILSNIFKVIEGCKAIDRETKENIKSEKEKFYMLLGQREKIIETFASSLSIDLKPVEKNKEKIFAYVEQNYTMIDSVKQVAEMFNYNYTYISRMFRTEKGVSMVKYITNKRIEASKKIMEEKPELNISTISSMVGYVDQHYFSRVFKSIIGVSPKEYKTMLEQ